MVETIRLDGSKAFLLERWTFTGNERQIFDAIMGALRALEWRVEAPARMPRPGFRSRTRRGGASPTGAGRPAALCR
jgi:hypothetical protein